MQETPLALDHILAASIDAVGGGMRIIRQAQLQAGAMPVDVKSDATIVTPTDRSVEAFMINKLRDLKGVGTLQGEEGGVVWGKGELTLKIDPLDGTRPFSLGLATSTVIVTAVHPARGVVLCVIGEPSTGRVWSATEGSGTELRVIGADGRRSEPRTVRVWPGPLNKQAAVFLDASDGFKRGDRQILTDAQLQRLWTQVASEAKVLMAGSNGQHLALVANGGTGAAAQITTAVGGAWDVAGLLLVQRAGGVVRAFSLSNGSLRELDQRFIEHHDLVISGNSRETVDRLTDMLLSAIG